MKNPRVNYKKMLLIQAIILGVVLAAVLIISDADINIPFRYALF